MIDEMYEGHNEMDISRDPSDYIEDDAFASDDSGDEASPVALVPGKNGVAWREIEKYRERKALESFLKDDLYGEFDFQQILD